MSSTFLKVYRQQHVRQMFLCDNNQSTGHTIEAVDDSRSKQAFGFCMLIKVVLDGVGKCSILKFTNGMGNKTDLFIHDHQPGVFINNFQWGNVRFQKFVWRFDKVDPDNLASKKSLRC